MFAQPDTTQKIISGRSNSPEQQKKSYVILISVDGFRYDYAEKYNATTILDLSSKGIKANSMIPSYPSLTFPNHYSIVTGMYPSHHGLVSNYFYDPSRKESYSMRNAATVKDGSWYGGVPLWVLAEQQQMLTASFYWVGSEADIQGIRPTYHYAYNEAIPIERRIQIVVDWLNLPAEKRPHLITFYFPEVDHDGHSYGPDSPKTAETVRWLDSSIKKLTDAVKTTGLPVNYILVSDHGMTNIDVENTLSMPSAVDTSKFIIPRGSELVVLYAKDKKDILPTYQELKKHENGFKVYFKSEMSKQLHYGDEDDKMNRMGDILLIPDWPKVFHFSSRKPNPGAHGYDPYKLKDMHASFFAWGPIFKNGITVSAFENVNVFPVITKILGLNYAHTIDGTKKLAEKILK
jgi:predicted AlkP superfamily pyrophosphatase or phosphodiesterase